jgi:hypothetical protein
MMAPVLHISHLAKPVALWDHEHLYNVAETHRPSTAELIREIDIRKEGTDPTQRIHPLGISRVICKYWTIMWTYKNK